MCLEIEHGLPGPCPCFSKPRLEFLQPSLPSRVRFVKQGDLCVHISWVRHKRLAYLLATEMHWVIAFNTTRDRIVLESYSRQLPGLVLNTVSCTSVSTQFK